MKDDGGCNIHLKLVLFTVQAYLEQALKDGTSKDDLHRKIVRGINGYRVFRRFTRDEHKRIVALGEDEYMQKLRSVEISFVVYALELLKLLIEDYNKFSIGVNKKALKKGGRGTFAIAMLAKKKENIEEYEKYAQIISTSIITAKQFYYYTKEKLCKGN